MRPHIPPQQTPRFIGSAPDTTEYLCPQGPQECPQAPHPAESHRSTYPFQRIRANNGKLKQKTIQNPSGKSAECELEPPRMTLISTTAGITLSASLTNASFRSLITDMGSAGQEQFQTEVVPGTSGPITAVWLWACESDSCAFFLFGNK